MKKKRRILITRTDRIGDVILSTPLIREVKRHFADSYLAVMVNPYTKDVLLNNPNVDSIILDEPTDVEKYSFFDQVKILRKHRFDTALMLLPSERLAWMLFLAGIPSRIGVGTKLYQVITFTRSVNRKKYIPLRHEADYCMDLGRKIGVTPKNLEPEIFVTEDEKKHFVQTFLKDILPLLNGKRLIGIHPGSNKSAPNWKLEDYIHLTQNLLNDDNNIIILTGNENEMHFVPGFKALNSERIINFIGKLSLRNLIILISLMHLVVSASTGPMHIASALKVRTVSLFCTLTACSPELWGPLGNQSKIITPPMDFCRKVCTDDPHDCDFKGSISVSEVQKAINDLI